MKKIIFSVVAALCCLATISVSAQETERTKGVETKKGYNILPAKGDFAIGVDATPFFKFAGNLFKGADAPSFGYNGAIYGKYFLKENRAVRFGLLLDVNNVRNRYESPSDPAVKKNPASEDKVTDRVGTLTSGVGLFGGYEFRRGYGRLQAFVGGDLGIIFYNNKTVYTYGNEMTKDNTQPTTNLGRGASPMSTRTLKSTGSNQFGIKVGAFAGIEYFFARKMSLGGQIGVDLGYGNEGKTTYTTQSWNSVSNKVVENSSNSSHLGSGTWAFSTKLAGNIFLMFHF